MSLQFHGTHQIKILFWQQICKNPAKKYTNRVQDSIKKNCSDNIENDITNKKHGGSREKEVKEKTKYSEQ